MRTQGFDDWYADQFEEWFHDRHEELTRAWQRLAKLGVPAAVIAESFTEVVRAIRDQYGD